VKNPYAVYKVYICDIIKQGCGDMVRYDTSTLLKPDCENCSDYKNFQKGKEMEE